MGVLKAKVNGVWEEVGVGADYLPLSGGTLSGTLTASAGIVVPSGDRIDFSGTTLGPRIHLYDDSFGLGIQGGTLQYFVTEAGNKHSFVVGTTEEAKVDQNGVWSQGSKVLTEASLGLSSGKAKDGVVMAVNDYFKLISMNGNDQMEFTIGISDGGGVQQIIHGSVTATVTATGTARITVFGESEFNNPINQLAFAWGDNYGLYIRCGRAGTYQVGWKASRPYDASRGSLADCQKQNLNPIYGTVAV